MGDKSGGIFFHHYNGNQSELEPRDREEEQFLPVGRPARVTSTLYSDRSIRKKSITNGGFDFFRLSVAVIEFSAY